MIKYIMRLRCRDSVVPSCAWQTGVGPILISAVIIYGVVIRSLLTTNDKRHATGREDLVLDRWQYLANLDTWAAVEGMAKTESTWGRSRSSDAA